MVAKPVTVGVVGVIVLASALVLNYFVLPDEESETARPVVASPAAPPAGAADRQKPSASRTSPPPAASAPPPTRTTQAVPSFDVVRVDPDGNAVLAGRGAPNSEIVILDDDEEIGRVTTDDRGEWVFIPPSQLVPGERVLWLRGVGPGDTVSSDAVVLVIPEKGRDIAGRPSAGPSTPLAVIVPRDPAAAGGAVARVLQAPSAGPMATDSTTAAPGTATAAAGAAATGGGSGSEALPSVSGAGPATASTAAGTSAAGASTSTDVAAAATAAAPSDQPSAGTDAATSTAAAAPATGGGQGTARESATAAAAPATTSSTPASPAPVSAAPTTAASAPSAPQRLADAAPAMSAYPERTTDKTGSDAAGASSPEVAVDVIDYDEKGDVVFSGRADPGARVEVFIDDRKVGDTAVDREGRWTMRPEQPVAPGAYQLRVDKVAESGTVQARIAFPFVRADPLTELPNNRLVVIQPGNNLWRIATRVYGDGVRFVEIFDANRDQILNPDLIYPGQVFGLPRVN